MSDKEVCESCGKIHLTYWGTPACTGHLKNSGGKEPCSKNPIRGHHVCRTHGGALKTTQAKAEENLALMGAMGEIGQLMRECDIPEQHPIDGLLEVVRLSGAMVRLLSIKVGELAEEPEVREVLVEGGDGSLSTKRVTDGEAFWGLNARGEMTPSIYVQMLETWTGRYERACKTALEAGIEERRIRLAEETSETFFTALTKAFQIAGLDAATKAALTQALAAELRGSSTIIEVEGRTA